MTLPPIETISGLAPNPSIDFGVKIPRRMKPRELTTDECVGMFGVRAAVHMNFIPLMIAELAIEQAEGFVDYCRDHRLETFKRHNRQLRRCIEEYRRAYRDFWGFTRFRAFEKYYRRLREYVDADIFKCWCTFTNEASRQYVGKSHNEVPARVTFTRMLLLFVEDYETGMCKLASERLDKPCTRKADPWLSLISLLCMDIAETFGAKMQITEPMALGVRVLANRCTVLADAIMEEETTGKS